jgi:hypothetical protein
VARAFTSLTGRWLGRYEYDAGPEPVPFEADLIEDLGFLSGETAEGNTFRPELDGTLHAVITGNHSKGSVHFTKTYLGFEADDHPIYSGRANANLTRIEGRWFFPSQPGWAGRFVMMRKPGAAAERKAGDKAEMELSDTRRS